MTQVEFFPWAEAQDVRYEFDGFAPVAMTGGTFSHSVITGNIISALRSRLRGTACQAAGPDAGVATTGDTVRYPDALITCSRVSDEARLIPGVVVVFEVISLTSGRTDRIVKVREYQAVASILRYIVVERTSVGATVFARGSGDAGWTATTVSEGEVLDVPEVGITLPIALLYEGTDLASTAMED